MTFFQLFWIFHVFLKKKCFFGFFLKKKTKFQENETSRAGRPVASAVGSAHRL